LPTKIMSTIECNFKKISQIKTIKPQNYEFLLEHGIFRFEDKAVPSK